MTQQQKVLVDFCVKADKNEFFEFLELEKGIEAKVLELRKVVEAKEAELNPLRQRLFELSKKVVSR